MFRNSDSIALFAAALLAAPVTVLAQTPVITQINPQPVAAGTGATITLTGSNFGAASDSVYFPGHTYGFAPIAWGAGSVTVVVPETWSGDVRVLNFAGGLLSGPFPFTMTYSWSATYWPTASLPVSWLLNQNGAPGCTITDVENALKAGYNNWACASGFTHSYGGTTALTGANHSDGNNVQYWSTTPWANPNLIAVATWTYIIATGHIIEADVHYNGADHSWSCNGSPTAIDVWNVASHEEGHTLGFLDLYGAADQPKTMFGGTGNGDTHQRSLHVYDVEGAEFVYPHAGRGNLTSGTPPGWWGPIVPRDTNDATSTWAPLPSSLIGNWPGYVSMADSVGGLDCISGEGVADLYLDDVYLFRRAWTGVGSPGDMVEWVNNGATVRGGRHTFALVHDPTGDIVESNEFDNLTELQFAWSPYGLADQVPVVRAAPPDRGLLPNDNCEAFQLKGNWWGGVGIASTGAGDDYDLLLFDDYVGSLQGYETVLASSSAGGDFIDYVLINGNVLGFEETVWAGVTRYLAPTAGNVVVCQSNQVGGTLFPSTTYDTGMTTGTITLAANQILKIHEVFLSDPNVTYAFDVDNLGTEKLGVAVHGPGSAYQGKGDALVMMQGVSGGDDVQALLQPTTADYYGVVVFKIDATDVGTANDYDLRVGPALSNLSAFVPPPGFSGSVVPRNTADATTTSALLPPVLNGPAGTVYVNWSVEQLGPNPVPPMTTHVVFDEENTVAFQIWPGVTEHGVGPWIGLNSAYATTMGGRHTVSLHADWGDGVPESDETDNVGDFQFVWEPLSLARAAPVLRPRPPQAGLLPNFNGDGMRFIRNSNVAWVVGIGQADLADDYDLVVYDDYSGSLSGFSSYVQTSGEVDGLTDFVVGHFQNTPVTLYPASILFADPVGAAAAVDATDATGRNANAVGSFLGQNLAQNRLVDVYEAFLEDGTTTMIRLRRRSGTAGLSFNVYPGTSGGVYARYSAAGFATPIGVDEDILFYHATETGWHPIVVFRPEGGDLDPIGYDLEWGPSSSTGIPGDTNDPVGGDLLPVRPNPLVGSARLTFDLPADQLTRLEIFDVRGARVRTLENREFAAGRHEVTWDRRDDLGARVGGGVYFVRFSTPETSVTRTLTVLP